jgi:hypothetical protein
VLGLGNLSAKAQDADVDLLLAMNDIEVREKVGDIFMQCLRAAPSVRDTFFPGAPNPEYSPTGPPENPANAIAVLLVAWSIGHISSNGFSRTVNEDIVRQQISGGLAPKNYKVRHFSDEVYKHYFSDLCKVGDVRFRDLMTKPNIGKRFCVTLLSNSFYVKTFARRSADPAGFTQYVHLLIYMAKVLAGGTPQLAWVYALWSRLADGPWTTYEFMSAARFNEQTFLPEVQSACATKEKIDSRTVTLGCHGGAGGGCSYAKEDEYAYGLAVENWINQLKRGQAFAGLFTNKGPDNKHWEG